jgi:hypothetical protein
VNDDVSVISSGMNAFRRSRDRFGGGAWNAFSVRPRIKPAAARSFSRPLLISSSGRSGDDGLFGFCLRRFLASFFFVAFWLFSIVSASLIERLCPLVLLPWRSGASGNLRFGRGRDAEKGEYDGGEKARASVR